MRFLIIGGLGYIGSRLVEYLSKTDNEIFIGTSQRQILTDVKNSRIIYINWNSDESLEKACSNVDVLIHAAGMNAEDCTKNPSEAYLVNCVYTSRLLNAAIKKNVKRILYFSTAHVYSSPLAGEITEDMCPRNLHPYAASHRAAEDVLRFASGAGRIESIIIRLSNSFGAPVAPDANCWMLFVNDLCVQALKANEMQIRSSAIQQRDFVPLHEVCRAINHLATLDSKMIGDGIFNVGGDWSPTLYEMAHVIAERIQVKKGTKPQVLTLSKVVPTTDWGPLKYSVDRLKSTGFEYSSGDPVNNELDRLIDFCSDHFLI